MARWPNVPAVYGWLALDRRGQWLLKGDRIGNPVVSDFISRNYEHDEAGRWFFQNGPQRVFVTLAYTPFVFRSIGAREAPLELVAHTGAKPAVMRGAFIDEIGAIVIDTDAGAGVLDDRHLDDFIGALRDATGRAPAEESLEAAIDSLQRGGDPQLWLEYAGGRVALAPLDSAEAPRRFGYDRQPSPPPGHPECT